MQAAKSKKEARLDVLKVNNFFERKNVQKRSRSKKNEYKIVFGGKKVKK